jgi:N-acetylglucosamine malate deacetylase 2
MTVAAGAHSVEPTAVRAGGDSYRTDRLSVQDRNDTSASPDLGVRAAAAGSPLPPARQVLVVTARPGPESADLGGLLHAFRRAGASLALLCLTRGEASPLNSTCERLETVRPWELRVAAGILGVSALMVSDFPDGGLTRRPLGALTERVGRAIREHGADLLLVADPAGSRDDARVAAAACRAARQTGVPVIAHAVPGPRYSWPLDLGAETAAARAIQRSAAAAHASQSQAMTEVRHRLDYLGGREHLCWLMPPVLRTRAGKRRPPSAGDPISNVVPGASAMLDEGQPRPSLARATNGAASHPMGQPATEHASARAAPESPSRRHHAGFTPPPCRLHRAGIAAVSTEATQRAILRRAGVTGNDLIVLAPWLVFGVGVAGICARLFKLPGPCRRRPRSPEGGAGCGNAGSRGAPS